MEDLPKPDCVFIGGSGTHINEIIDAVLAANELVTLCISSITLETLGQALTTLNSTGRETEIVMLSVSELVPAGNKHMLSAKNPVFLITSKPQKE